jgi:ribose transport system permease protein
MMMKDIGMRSAEGKNIDRKKWLGKNIWVWPLIGAVALWILIGAISGGLSLDVLVTNFTLASYLIILSLGQTAVMTSGEGGIDLSIQYTVALGAYFASMSMMQMGAFPGFILTIAVCACVGLLNGLVNIYIKVPPMITTLAMGYIVYSIVLVMSASIPGTPAPEISWFAQKARIGGISPIILVALGIAALVAVLLYKTKYGKRLHAVGQNRKAAQLTGISVPKTVILTFILSSVLAGLTGIFLGGYFGGAFQDMGISYMLTSIAATVIGGTSVAGGKSSVLGTIMGALMLTMLVAFLNVSKLQASMQNLIQGILLIGILVASVPKKQVNI